ncbi:MAG TPA: hypothetical protein VFW96_13250 [Thermomicrobiales bacterium]|nr:hypothetical protein [Thermomicrobiales bacterium]
MYVVATLWKFGGADEAREARRRLRDDYGALVRQEASLRDWYLVAVGADEALVLSFWESRATYEAALPRLAGWGQQYLADLGARVQYRRRGDLAAREPAGGRCHPGP